MIWAPGIVILKPSLVLSAEKVLVDLELEWLPETLPLALQNPNPALAWAL